MIVFRRHLELTCRILLFVCFLTLMLRMSHIQLRVKSVCNTLLEHTISRIFFIIIYQDKLLLDQIKVIDFLFDKGVINPEIVLNCIGYKVL